MADVAGFSKTFPPRKISDSTNVIHLDSTPAISNTPRQFQFGRCAAHSRQHRHSRAQPALVETGAGIHREGDKNGLCQMSPTKLKQVQIVMSELTSGGERDRNVQSRHAFGSVQWEIIWPPVRAEGRL